MDSPEGLVTDFEWGDARELVDDLCISLDSFDGYPNPDSDSTVAGETWSTNPATDQAWVQAEVNALQAGLVLDATSWIAQVTQVYVTVRVDGQDVVLRPNGPGSTSGWSRHSCTANWACVDEASADGTTTYVSGVTVGASDLYALQDLPQAGPIDWVTVTAVGRVPMPRETGDCWATVRLQVDPGSTTYAYADGPTGMKTLSSMTKAGTTMTLAWDPNGNLRSRTTGTTRLCTDWNPENLMTAARQIGSTQSCDITQGTVLQSYVYDGLGRRVNVTTGSTWTVSIVAGMDVIYETNETGAVTRYVYANGMRIARIDCTAANPPTCTTKYYLGDYLGSWNGAVLRTATDPSPPSPSLNRVGFETVGTKMKISVDDVRAWTTSNGMVLTQVRDPASPNWPNALRTVHTAGAYNGVDLRILSSADNSTWGDPHYVKAGAKSQTSEADAYAIQDADRQSYYRAQVDLRTTDDTSPALSEIVAFEGGLNSSDNSHVLGAEPWQYYAGSTVNVVDGNLHVRRTDLVLPGKGWPLAFARAYNSLEFGSGPLGVGWTHAYNASLASGSGTVSFKDGDGSTHVFQDSGGARTRRLADWAGRS